ncbi:phycocyanin alpha phycocyanobilin lyase [Leptolyngbya valderiana BDU 20041]|nr:HEAT repeat domain-containing protein [Geitlerinema sp. CS-897]OAB61174.1 phycocyanin alpha phycocyanobilin lyase [Leptolyngbya valderiana BDU 20041]PPT10835.1 Phycocyanin alpha phycocyanobilin lyase related protein NblB [Geitlerinema sp. FC II]
MSVVNLSQISTQLESENARDRLLALVSLRNVPATDAVPLIKKVLNDEHMPLRSMAIFALGIKQTDECYDILIDLLRHDPDYGIRADAAGALGYLEDPRAFEPLVRAFLEETDWLVRFSAAVSLGNLKNPEAYSVLVRALNSQEVVLQQAAIAALGEIGATQAVEDILRFARSEDWLVRQRLAEALGHLDHPKSRPALAYLQKDSHPQVSQAATVSLQRLNSSV